MTPLARLLAARIRTTGPITLADYMGECLLHPEHGYYTRANPFGAAGDFITAPEISQMFGELLGLWLAQAWLDQGAPAPFVLAELGPGRGTLMADILRATRNVPGFRAAAQAVLVEASPRLRREQAARLADYPVDWVEGVVALPAGPLFLVANEFFDALPVRQFTRDGAGWAETMVTLDGNRLALARAAPAPLAPLVGRLADTQDGEVVEICPGAVPIITEIARRIARNGGAALIVDYGGWQSRGDTVQAVRDHHYVDLLETPGQADLTAHVDFAALAATAQQAGTRSHGPVDQGTLLERLGIHQRAARLAANMTGATLTRHEAATRRLTAPAEMGTLFKALALMPPGAATPAGFAE